MLPPFFEKYGNISTVSGVLNACTYVGSAISTYGVAILSENVGWNSTIFLWFLVAAAGCAICLGCMKPWTKKFCE
jgi:OPA family glycerol-3-phosphate transporter-like MFS transporter